MADVQTELTAMRRIANTLDALDEAARQRAMRWLFDRYDQASDETAERNGIRFTLPAPDND
jgi:hypothetical protein